jgi:ribonucleoside-triphosphate reductase
MKSIRKREGNIEVFEKGKIIAAMNKAFIETGLEIENFQLESLCDQVIEEIERKGKTIPEVEEIQDEVENVLIRNGYVEVAKKYIAYREKHKVLRKDRNVLIDAITSIDEYVSQADWRVKENANQGFSLGGLILNTAGKITANYWLNHVYSPQIAKAHINADFHIHDLNLLGGYCAGWSLKNLLNEGFNGVPDKIESKPPKHLSSALMQMVNFLGTLQNEWAGAQSFSSFDTYLAPYVYKDKLDYEEVKQLIQQFVFNLNTPSRWGCQSPFVNLTFDWTVPDDLKDKIPLCNNEPLLSDEPHLRYKDFTKEMAMINKAYLEVMVEGDKQGRVFTFPIPTYNITEEFDWEGENVDLLFDVTAKYGIPYFQNFIGSQYKYDEHGNKIRNEEAYTPGAVRSMCCRLQLDLSELLKRGNGLFGSAEMTGSIGVVTLNMARLGYLFKGDAQGLVKEIKRLMILGKESLEMKRKIVQKNLDRGLYPYTKRYLGHLRNHFSTIGVNGMNEMIENFFDGKENISTEKGITFAIHILEMMRDEIKQFQEETGNLYNLEATPAESTTYRFAKEDVKRFGNDIIQAGFGEYRYYTNSSQLPVGFTEDPFKALDLQDELQIKYTGGTVLHMYLGEKMQSSTSCKSFVKKILSNYKLPYITITPTFSICPNHGYLTGEHPYCPKCEEKVQCEVWTRVMGYYRPVSQFNIGKKGEFYQREYFKENEMPYARKREELKQSIFS